jgi:hypothetical protein
MAVVFLGIGRQYRPLATKAARGSDLLSVAFFRIVMGAWLLG